MCLVPLTEMQAQYLQRCNHRWNIKTGATGSGKSFLDYAVVIPKRILAARGEGLLVMLGNTRGTLIRNILEPMQELWPGLVGNVRSDNTVRMFGKRVYALGADSRKHVARIQGATIEWGYGDEMTTWAQEVFEMLKSRLRCEHSHFDGTCNPDSPSHWLKKFLDGDADIYHQAYTIDDNCYLPAEFVSRLKREYAGTVYYDRFILGRWVAAEGAIYRPFADNQTKYRWTGTRADIGSAYIGVDFGGNGSAHAFVLMGVLKRGAGVVALREYYRKEIITPDALERDFVRFARECAEDYGPLPCYCDSAETVLIHGLRTAALRERVPVDIHNARKGEVNDRIRFTLRLMGAGRWYISEECERLKEALQGAVWDSKSVTRDKRLDDGTTNVDSLDAMEYALEYRMKDIMTIGGIR